jgi:hypothetical protein
MNMKKSIADYENLADKLNSKYPSLKAKVNVVPVAFGGRIEIEVSTVGKAKILKEMYTSYTFTSGLYR